MTRTRDRDLPLGTVPLPGEWAAEGACVGQPTDWWFPGMVWRDAPWPVPMEKATAIWAKGICAGCPVSRECLAHALRYREAGIWAGTTESERRRMKRRGVA